MLLWLCLPRLQDVFVDFLFDLKLAQEAIDLFNLFSFKVVGVNNFSLYDLVGIDVWLLDREGMIGALTILEASGVVLLSTLIDATTVTFELL